MKLHGPALALVLALLAAPEAGAVQNEPPGQGVGTGALVYARATGPFARSVRHALGLTVTAHQNLERRGILSFGVEATYLLYDYDTWYVGSGGEVETKSHVVTLGVGPQLRAPLGPLEPYVTASAGAALFVTGACAQDAWTYADEGCTETFHALNLAFPASAAGGGLRIRLTGGSEPISLDLGARYQVTPRVRYVTQGGVEVVDDVIRLTTAKSRTAVWLFYVGVSMRM